MDLILWLFVLVVTSFAVGVSWFVWSDFAEVLGATPAPSVTPEQLAVINCTAGHWVL